MNLRRIARLLPAVVISVVLVALAVTGTVLWTSPRARATAILNDTAELLDAYMDCSVVGTPFVMPEDIVRELPGQICGKTLLLVFKDTSRLREVANLLKEDRASIRKRIDEVIHRLDDRDRLPLVMAEVCLTDIEMRLAVQNSVLGDGFGVDPQKDLLKDIDWHGLRSRQVIWEEEGRLQVCSEWAVEAMQVLNRYLVQREGAARRSGVALYGPAWLAGASSDALSMRTDAHEFRLFVRNWLDKHAEYDVPEGKRELPARDERASGLFGLRHIGKVPPGVGGRAKALLMLSSVPGEIAAGVIEVKWESCSGPQPVQSPNGHD